MVKESSKLIITTIVYLSLIVAAQEKYKEEKWFNIVSRVKDKCYNMAIDVDINRTSCYGNYVIVCPWNKTKRSQQWRWNGRRIESRLNGKVWRREGLKSRTVILTDPHNHTDQYFQTYPEDFHIYYDADHYFKNVVVEIHCRTPIYGADINIFNIHPLDVTTQLFDFETVYE